MIKKEIIKQYDFFVLFLLSILVLSFFFFYPFFSLIFKYFSFQSFVDIFHEKYLHRVLFATIKQSLPSTFFSLLVASVFLLVLMNREFKLKALFMRVSYLPFVLPSIVLVLSFVVLFGRQSFLHINILYSLKAVVVAHTFYNFPIIMHSVYQKYMCMDRKLDNVAYTLGANKLYTFFHVTLRELKSVIISSSLLVFMYTFSSFAIVLTLGGGVKNTTLEVEIYKNFKIVNNKTIGTSYALLSFLIMLILMTTYYIITKNEKKEIAKVKRELKKGGAFHSIIAILVSIILIMPIIGLFISLFSRTSRNGKSISLFSSFKEVFTHYDIFINSFIIAFFSSFIVVFLSFIISEYLYRNNKRDIDTFVFLPLSFSSIALSQGWRSFALSSRLSIIIALSCLHAFLAFPLVYRIVNNGVKSLPKNTLLSPLTLGSSHLYAMFVLDLPSIKNTIKKAITLAFAMSLGEMSGSLIMASSSFNTLSTAIYSYISRYNYTSASIVSIILCLIVLLLYEK